MPKRHNIFLLGVLVGAISIGMLWAILFTSLNCGAKLAVFVLCTILGIRIQMYALNESKKPDFWQRYSLTTFQQEIRNYKWFGVFVFGAASPYMLSFFIYAALKNL